MGEDSGAITLSGVPGRPFINDSMTNASVLNDPFRICT